MIDAAPPPEPPAYVIVIQADDLGYDDIAINGNPFVDTPNLDRLGRESLRATHFTVNPVCSASRASFLTGRDFLRTGVSHVHGGKDFLHLDEITLGDAFGSGGWATAIWGKWHCGDANGYYPWERGFDEAYMAKLYQHREAFGRLNGSEVNGKRWSDERIVDHAIDYLNRHRDEPAFLYLASMTPHTPLDCPDSYKNPYLKQGLSTNLATLYGMVSFFDHEIGRLLDYLDKEGLTSNTLLLFFSDNGPAINNGILSDEDRFIRKTSARRGWKGDIWENGVRSPLFIRWPAAIGSGVVRGVIDQKDLYPTLLELCRIPLPDGQLPLDGHSFAEALIAGKQPQQQVIYNYAHPGWITSKRTYTPVGIRGEYSPVTLDDKRNLEATDQPISITNGNYKLLFNPFPPEDAPANDDRFVLVDLGTDPGETQDIKSAYPTIYDQLKLQLIDWYEGIKASPHAYTSPCILLKSDTTIDADSVCKLSDSLQNTVHYIQGWNAVGQYAEYNINVDQAGRYAVTLEWLVPPQPDLTFQVSVNDGRTIGTSDGTFRTELGVMELQETICGLEIKLVSCPADYQSISKLESIYLRRL